MSNTNNDHKFPVLPGANGDNGYVAMLITVLGILSLRRSEGEVVYRVCVEPTSAREAKKLARFLPESLNWTQSGQDGEQRFSRTCHIDNEAALQNLVRLAAEALLRGQDGGVVNPGAPGGLKALLLDLEGTRLVGPDESAQHPAEEHQDLVTAVQEAGVPGANGAKNWSLATLRSKAKAV